MVQDIDTSFRKPSLPENVANGPEALGGQLRALEDGRITSSKREGYCPDAQNEWSVPRKYEIGSIHDVRSQSPGGLTISYQGAIPRITP
jgi:hypothetical protein